MLTIGWFSTGRDEAARQLLQVVYQKVSTGEIKGKLDFVFSNREPGEAKESDLFLDLVQDYRIPLICFSYNKFKDSHDISSKTDGEMFPKWRLEYDREVMKRLNGFNPDLCVLAGYMLIVGEEMCHRYDMINLHPATPEGPKGMWQEVIWTLIENKAVESGVLMNLVTPELDRGPVITYCTYPIRGEPFDKYWQEVDGCSVAEIKIEQGESNALFKLIRQHGLVREFPLIVATLKAFGQGEVKIKSGRVFDCQGRPIAGYNLSDEVNKAAGF
ncbi:MAG: phosphoglycerate transporter [Chloroflexota bacterium]|nr:MAG: phosphoglycerate transporter [Chloroflexota bacterium]